MHSACLNVSLIVAISVLISRHTAFTFTLTRKEVKEVLPASDIGELSQTWKDIFQNHLREKKTCPRLQFAWAKLNRDTERFSWLRGFAYCKDHKMEAYRFKVDAPPKQEDTRVTVHVSGTARQRKQPKNI
jgi:hypothetical protein